MKERPILFSAPMVRALLEGRKTQTRRVVKYPRSTGAFVCVDYGDGWWPFVSVDGESFTDQHGNETPISCPYGRAGDRLWVKERGWLAQSAMAWLPYVGNESDITPVSPGGLEYKTVPSLFMPRWCSRITLEVTEVRVQRLQEISPVDAIDEGVMALNAEWLAERFAEYAGNYEQWRRLNLTNVAPPLGPTPVQRFERLWESINGGRSWDMDPWVWAVSFRRITQVECERAR